MCCLFENFRQQVSCVAAILLLLLLYYPLYYNNICYLNHCHHHHQLIYYLFLFHFIENEPVCPGVNMDRNYPNPSSSKTPSSSSHPNKPSTADEDIMELLWNEGHLVMHNQGQRLPKRSSPLAQSSSHQQQQQQNQQIFMHEDDMCSWLHYPLVEDSSSFDQNFCADLLYHPTPPPPPPPSSSSSLNTTTVTAKVATTTVPVRTTHVTLSEPKLPNSSQSSARGVLPSQTMPPPLLSRVRPETEPSVQNFGFFSTSKTKATGSAPSIRKPSALADTVVDSSDTPSIEMEAAKQRRVDGGKSVVSGFGATSGGEKAVCDTLAVSSSPGASTASGDQGLKQTVEEDRKRKGIEIDEAEGQSEDVESESADTKKQARGSTSSKRSRAAEVHNLSERRRRDRINEKMKALQELIPRCNKSDKASMLDEAIEYLKSLQMQVQMMSMGYGMVPMMYPGMQQYMPPMGMGLGMGMNLDMGMNRPMMPFPFPSSPFPAPGASAHMGPRYPMPPPPFHMPPTPVQDPSRYQTNQSDPMLSSGGAPNIIPPRVPQYTDPYQQYRGPQMQLTLQQNQVMPRPNTSSSGPSGGADNADDPKSG